MNKRKNLQDVPKAKSSTGHLFLVFLTIYLWNMYFSNEAILSVENVVAKSNDNEILYELTNENREIKKCAKTTFHMFFLL